jgi:hemerythrin
MTWKESLSIGIPEIDKQHKELCDKIDSLYDACSHGKGAAEAVKILDFLESYTTRHFADEEKIQLKIQYPKYQQHKKLHADFIKEIARLKKEMLASGATIAMVVNINQTISDWLVNHILRVDSELKKYVGK